MEDLRNEKGHIGYVLRYGPPEELSQFPRDLMSSHYGLQRPSIGSHPILDIILLDHGLTDPHPRRLELVRAGATILPTHLCQHNETVAPHAPSNSPDRHHRHHKYIDSSTSASQCNHSTYIIPLTLSKYVINAAVAAIRENEFMRERNGDD